jgi:hypothetical protein
MERVSSLERNGFSLLLTFKNSTFLKRKVKLNLILTCPYPDFKFVSTHETTTSTYKLRAQKNVEKHFPKHKRGTVTALISNNKVSLFMKVTWFYCL